MKTIRLTTTTLFAIFLITLTVFAGEESKPQAKHAFKSTTKSVAIFKDGYGFFLREGRASLLNGWCMTDYIPKATAGSFWFYTLEPGTSVNTIRSTGKNEIRIESPSELAEELGRHIGLQINLQTEESITEGELLRVVDGMALVKSGKEVKVVQIEAIKAARIIGQPLLIQVDGAKPAQDITMMMGYLQEGISWIPTYTLDLVSPTEAKITLRATVTNGVEDLKDCKIFFVVGVPNYSMKGQFDPLTVHALGSAVLTSLPEAARGLSQAVRNAQFADSTRAGRPDYDQEIPTLDLPSEGLQDMYFYEKEGLDMAAGDVVMTTVLTGTLAHRSVFTWDADAGKDVYHYLVIRNNLDVPLTTGPVMVLQNGKPLSQDQMKYISAKAEGRLKLTQTTDIRTNITEKEIERRPNETIDRAVYIPVVSQGKLVVENHRREAAEIEVSWTVNGEIMEVSEDVDITSQAKITQGLNPTNSLKCTINVEPGKQRTITYTCLRYVRAQA